jgi:hypothetical protein
MPITDIIIVSVITIAFLAFAVVLAWGDYQTRDIARASRERALSSTRGDSLKRRAGSDDRGALAGQKGRAPAHV